MYVVCVKDNYTFPRLQRESNSPERGVQLLIPYRNPYNLSFSRESLDPLSPPSRSALVSPLLAHLSHRLRLSYCDERISVIRPSVICL